MRITTVTVAPYDLDADSIATSQTPLEAGNLTLDGAKASGGVATLPVAQKLTVTSAGDDRGVTFTVTGIGPNSVAQTEAITGANAGAATSTKYWKSVSQIAVSGATAGAVTVGNTMVSVSDSFSRLREQSQFSVGIGCVTSGTIDYTVQHTYDNTNWFAHATIAGKTGNFDGAYTTPVAAIRVIVNSASAGGSVAATYMQCEV